MGVLGKVGEGEDKSIIGVSDLRIFDVDELRPNGELKLNEDGAGEIAWLGRDVGRLCGVEETGWWLPLLL